MFFRLGLSGLQAASSNLEVTANNVANASTTGFKASRAEFVDVFAVNGRAVAPTQIGDGVRLAAVSQKFTQGNIHYTDQALDMAISGKGFFTLRGPEGISYTRAGAFSTDRKGFVVNNRGMNLQVYPPMEGGGFDRSTMVDLQLTRQLSPPKATTKATIGINLPSDAKPPIHTTFDPGDAKALRIPRR